MITTDNPYLNNTARLNECQMEIIRADLSVPKVVKDEYRYACHVYVQKTINFPEVSNVQRDMKTYATNISIKVKGMKLI